MSEERVLWEAEFNQKVTVYWLLSGALALSDKDGFADSTQTSEVLSRVIVRSFSFC